MKFLFLTTRLDRPSYRFRLLPMIPRLMQQGVDVTTAVIPSAGIRRWTSFPAYRQYDAVVVQQRTFHPWETAWLARNSKRLIYDVDDAVMINPSGSIDPHRARRFAAMVQRADLTICGNQYLAAQVRNAAPHARVEVIPTVVDTDRYVPANPPRSPDASRIVVGWTGSQATVSYLNAVLPALVPLADRIRLVVMSDRFDALDPQLVAQLDHELVPWSPEKEVDVVRTFDIGLMPLPDTPFTRGKCGCKAIQYMAMEIPAVCSPVGMNCDLITSEKDGFLASSVTEWRDAIARLIDDPNRREQVGKSGRKRVVESYSLSSVAPRFVELCCSVAGSKNKESENK